jgi:hypothetical protein
MSNVGWRAEPLALAVAAGVVGAADALAVGAGFGSDGRGESWLAPAHATSAAAATAASFLIPRLLTYRLALLSQIVVWLTAPAELVRPLPSFSWLVATLADRDLVVPMTD